MCYASHKSVSYHSVLVTSAAYLHVHLYIGEFIGHILHIQEEVSDDFNVELDYFILFYLIFQ